MGSDAIVLRSKLMAPRMPPGMVARPRLLERLEPARAVTLLCAPAGFGKTVAVTSWLSARGSRCAWLSLDEGDNDLTRFFVHLVAAVQTVAPNCGRPVVAAASGLRDTDVPALALAFANELHEVEEPFFLVLDDYHLVEASAVHDIVGFLIEHMPEAMRLVITSRREPPLPLPRWRMRRRLTELGQAELRFVGEEVELFLNQTMELDLRADQAALLEQRTEGWVGGLQLAALSLAQRTDRAEFIAAFAGDDRYILDYLTAEVLGAQPEDVRRFLLRTSVLERMNASLCEAVSGQSGCADLLDRLERERLFVIALDNKREWYRYHHLFQGLLQHQLAASDEEQLRDCNSAASRWYEDNGSIDEAVRHALSSSDLERVGELVERHGWSLAMSGRSKTVVSWMRQIPESVLLANTRRLHVAVWCQYIRTGEIQESWRAQALANPLPGPEGKRIEDELRLLDVFEAARDPGRYREVVEQASQLERDQATSAFMSINASGLLASCAFALGQLDIARRACPEAVAKALEHDFITGFFMQASALGRLRCLESGPVAARKALEEARAVTATRGWDALPVSCTLLTALGDVLYEMGELAACEAVLERAVSLAEHEPSTFRHFAQLRLARLRYTQGNIEACDELLGMCEGEPYIWPLIPILPDLGVERAWLDMRRGRLGDVQAFLESRGFGRDGRDELSLVHGPQDAGPLLIGRYLILRHQHARAIAVLTRVIEAAVAAGRVETAIRARLDLALARFLGGQRQEAFQQLDAVVDSFLCLDSEDGRAAPRGYRQIFADAPGELKALCERRLQAAPAGKAQNELLHSLLASGPTREAALREAPIEPLSPSERKVLEQLVAGLSNKEIGQSLFVSPNTVKTHIRRVYAKLGAKNRAEAIRAAQALGLVRP